ncbi:translocation protein TolB [Helicobacter monodelphidis]|uniref:Tol-Pal system protein TolB n=1 Tax=Helicobacter sp. 15-1451 TaxID=2004995 RepID=UPI000DCE2A60|nr:Tol-Pal system protein TolB [Helicobacter sp. 15-1451]RAX58396.1 translocation protein TolB [Helicobacter sp. 15-1451]
MRFIQWVGLVVLAMVASLKAAPNDIDATMEIIRRSGALPTISVEYIQSDSKSKPMVARVHKMLVGDLKVSGHFSVQEETSPSNLNALNFDKYRSNAVHFVAKVNAKYDGKAISAQLYFYDVNKGQEIFSKRYSVGQDSHYPLLAHKMAVDINQHLNFPSLEWMERFVLVSKYISPKRTQILLADYTLTFQSVLIDNNLLNTFPKWANKEQTEFYYTKYLKRPTLFKYNIQSKKEEQILNSKGMLVVSDVSKDGNKLLLTMAPTSQSDIYLYNLGNKKLTQLTRYAGIDVGASFVGNESKIVFVSDRLGYPNVFTTDVDGSERVEQLVYHGNNSNAATAFEDYIVYSSRTSSNEFAPNSFNLFLASTKSSAIRPLTDGGINQMPRFSKDGKSILYIKHTPAQSSLGIIRLDYNKSYLFALPKGKIQSLDW